MSQSMEFQRYCREGERMWAQSKVKAKAARRSRSAALRLARRQASVAAMHARSATAAGNAHLRSITQN